MSLTIKRTKCTSDYILHKLKISEAVARRYPVKKVFLKILQNSQENTCGRASSLIRPAAILKTRLWWYRCFPVNFAKFLKASFFIEYLRWLLPKYQKQENISPQLKKVLLSKQKNNMLLPIQRIH